MSLNPRGVLGWAPQNHPFVAFLSDAIVIDTHCCTLLHLLACRQTNTCHLTHSADDLSFQ